MQKSDTRRWTQILRIYFGPASLALLANAGQIKGNPLLAWIPVDLTLLATVFVFVACLASRLKLGPSVGYIALPLLLWVSFLPPIGQSHLDPYGLSKTITLFSVSFLAAISPFFLLRSERQRVAFLHSLAVLSVTISISALVLSPTMANDVNGRLVFEGSNTIGTGRVALIGSIVLIVLLLLGVYKLWIRLLFLVGIVLSAVMGVMTGSAGPSLAAVITLLAVIVLSPSFVGRRIRATCGILVLVVGTIIIASARDSDGMERIAKTISGEASTSVGARMELWKDAIYQIPVNPFGVGWGMYSSDYLPHRYPHNLLLEVGIEAGWFPVVLLVILILGTLFRGFKIATEPTMTVILGLFIFSFINSMVSSDVNGTRLFWIAMFSIWVVPVIKEKVEYPHKHHLRTERHYSSRY